MPFGDAHKLSCTDWGKKGQGKVDIRHARTSSTSACVTSLKPSSRDRLYLSHITESTAAAIPTHPQRSLLQFPRPSTLTVAEFFGTAALVTIGSGAATTLTQSGAASVHTVGAAFGLTLTALMYSMSHTGASQFNPIVSVALMLCQHLSAAQCFLNIFFQVRARLAFTDRAGGEAEQAEPEQELGGRARLAERGGERVYEQSGRGAAIEGRSTWATDHRCGGASGARVLCTRWVVWSTSR